MTVFFLFANNSFALVVSNNSIIDLCTGMVQNLRVCRRCGVVFDIEIRKNKDCPLCQSGENIQVQLEE
jgi:rubrerythrin